MPISHLDLTRIVPAMERFFRALEEFPRLPKPTNKLDDAHQDLMHLLMPSGVDYNCRLDSFSDITQSDLDLKTKAILKKMLRDCLSPKGMHFIIDHLREETLLEFQDWIQLLKKLHAGSHFSADDEMLTGPPIPDSTKGNLAGPNGSASAEPRVPLNSWSDIVYAVGKRMKEKRQIMSMNERYTGPIKVGGAGKRPFVYKDELLSWWNGMEVQAQDTDNRRTGRILSGNTGHSYGRDGTVATEIGGGVKKRRRPKQT